MSVCPRTAPSDRAHRAQRPRQRRQRRVAATFGSHGLPEPGHLVVDDVADGLRRAVSRAQAGAAGGQHQACAPTRCRRHDAGDIPGLVGHGLTPDGEAQRREASFGDVAAVVLACP